MYLLHSAFTFRPTSSVGSPKKLTERRIHLQSVALCSERQTDRQVGWEKWQWFMDNGEM